MKKTALLLVLVMLLSVFAGCKNTETNVSDISDESSQTNEVSKEISEDTRIPVENPQNATVISTGTSYENDSVAGDAYPDTYGTELTDGQFAPDTDSSYSDSKYSGYTDSTVFVTIDLGKVYDNIYEFRCSHLSINAAGIFPPGSVKIMVSEDGEKYTNVGYCKVPELEEGTRKEAVYTSEYYITARFVKFAVSKSAAWVFLDELMVIANEDDGGGQDEAFRNLIQQAYTELGAVSFDGGKTADKSLALQLVSKDAKYAVDTKALSDFTDDGKNLTDGKYTGYFESGIWVGYKGGEAVNITIDLGEKRDDLSVFRTECYSNMKTGTYFPVAVTYAVSDDNQNFTVVGRVFGVASGQSSYGFPLKLDKCASGRYVRVTLEATDTKMYLVEEVAVFANTGVTDEIKAYPDLVFDPTVKNWPNPSGNVTNLILGLTQQINCPSDLNAEQKKNSSPVTSKMMTDGKKATSNSIHNGQFFKFNGGSSRDIIYDLGATSAVQKFTAQFTHLVEWAVIAPTSVTVLLSMDGENWYKADVMTVNAESENTLVSAEVSLKTPVQTRYVCFSFGITTWCGVGELEVFGTTSTSGATALTSAGFKKYNLFGKENKAPDKNVLGGAGDLCLLYHSPSFDGYTVEQLIPYLAYVDKEGNIKDTMFDSFLFLLSSGFPSGLSGWNDSKASDWEWTLTDLFTEGENILALEEAAGTVKDALKLDESFKYGFTVTLYYPNNQRTDFGDINGDGVVDSLTTDENRIRALEWYMEIFEAKLAEYDFKNIEFQGYYWYDESIYSENNTPYIVSETAKIVHERGYDFFWIPYYTAKGFSAWDSFGFDIACMQPNYVFKVEDPYSRLEQTAYLTKLYGMGIEIEISSNSFTNDILYKKYLEYLSGGVLYGYMEDCVHMYYQDVLVYYTAANSKDERIRQLYDYTYEFIKGTLDVHPEKLDDISVSCTKDTAVSGVIVENAPGYMSFDLELSPASGSISIASDGSFTYYPAEGFTGTVTVAYTYNMGLFDSEPCYITITVE